ncbi:DUF6241 domain-containing protein [Bacillus cytotoxicus]|uniref:DUF6241 domain-containing protein n=1 Tax=Bacillus cereus group sp. BfR-BA-01492 TaxID=2920361 RepID=UPI001F59FD7C|nr:DUF6241 domain-containing protein [Bacillus cereus group sp. BfR-BA-01492]
MYITLIYSSGKTEETARKVQKKQSSNYVVSNEELSRAAKVIGEIKDEQTLNHKMMEMLFQKLTFDNDNFKVPNVLHPKRIQMTKENIQYLKNNLDIINDDDEKNEYKSILNKWYNGDFKSVVEDFKKLRYLLWGDKALTPAKKTDKDEKEYILHFFGQEGLDIHNKQWK